MRYKSFLHIGGVLHGLRLDLPEQQTTHLAHYYEPQPVMDLGEPVPEAVVPHSSQKYKAQRWMDHTRTPHDLMVNEQLSPDQASQMAHQLFYGDKQSIVEIRTICERREQDSNKMILIAEDLEWCWKWMEIANKSHVEETSIRIQRFFGSPIGIISTEQWISSHSANVLTYKLWSEHLENYLRSSAKRFFMQNVLMQQTMDKNQSTTD